MEKHNTSEIKRAVIFDFGGVIMKTVDQRPRHEWDERLGRAHGSVELVVHGSDFWRQAQLGNLSVADYWSLVAEALGLRADEIEQLAQDYFSGDRLDADVLIVIRELKAHGHAIALLSNDSPALAEKMRVLEIADLFDPLIISGNIGVMKPDPAAYQTVLTKMQRPADETIFIDDMPANIAGAEAVGIHGVHYADGMDLRAALKPLLVVNGKG